VSECGVCLYGDYSDCEGMIDDVRMVRLDRNERCSECRGVVLAGVEIEEASWFDEGDPELQEDNEAEKPPRKPIYTCAVCAEIAEAFYCGGDGRIYGGNLWEQMYEVMNELTTSCFDRLKTPEAKAELRRRWIANKGLAHPLTKD
jgi:hypothetical protein